METLTCCVCPENPAGHVSSSSPLSTLIKCANALTIKHPEQLESDDEVSPSNSEKKRPRKQDIVFFRRKKNVMTGRESEMEKRGEYL